MGALNNDVEPISVERQVRVFLDAVFANKAPDENVFIWLLRGEQKLGASFRSIEEAEAYVKQFRERYNIYYEVGTSNRPLQSSGHRYSREEITAIYGMWSDVDYGTNEDERIHKKGNLPPTENDALRVVYGIEQYPPSIVMNSGHGLQAFWLFDEPVSMRDTAEHAGAQEMAQMWYWLIANTAARVSGTPDAPWAIDATWDVSRVMRLPGTRNFKAEENVTEARILEYHPERRYNASEMRAFLQRHAERAPLRLVKSASQGDVRVVQDGLVLSTTAQLPAKWTTLVEKYPRAEQVILHEVALTEGGNLNSLSEYDASLAAYAAREEWTDQEITDLLVYHRMQYHHNRPATWTKDAETKLMRPDYYARTIANARALVAEEVERNRKLTTSTKLAFEYQAKQRSTTQTPESEPKKAKKQPEAPSLDYGSLFMGDDEAEGEEERETPPLAEPTPGLSGEALRDARAESFADLAKMIFGDGRRVEIRNILRMVAAKPQFRLELTVNGEDININLGEARVLINPRLFAEQVAGQTKLIPLPYKAGDWRDIAQNMLAWVEDTDIGDEATETGLVTGWLRSYLGAHTPANLDDQDEDIAAKTLATTSAPIRRDGAIYIFQPHFAKWLAATEMERLTHTQLGTYLRTRGCTPQTVKIGSSAATRTSVGAWRVAPDIAASFLGLDPADE